MAAHLYQQMSTAGRGSPVERPRPRALDWLFLGTVASVLLLAALPTVMVIDRDGTLATILRDQPDLNPRELGIGFGLVIAYSFGFHAISAAILIIVTVHARRGRAWGRIGLTAYLVLATIFGLNSATAGPGYLVVVIISDAIHLGMVALLWLPPSVRTFFAAHRTAQPPATS